MNSMSETMTKDSQSADRAMPAGPIIAVRGVAKSFDEKVVLGGIDLDVVRGETLVVIGRSGTGKSVLLKIVAGLMRPDRGTVSVAGSQLDQLSHAELLTLRMKMGFVFQAAALFDSLTIAENIGLGLRENTKMHPLDIRSVIEDRLEWVGLVGQGDKYPSQLSGGMRKRASLARAIAMNPEIVLYDEPTTGLDPITADGINDLIVALRERLDVTAIAVTHDMSSAFKIGDRIAMLHEGQIVFNDTVAAARSTDNPLLRQFVAGSAAI